MCVPPHYNKAYAFIVDNLENTENTHKIKLLVTPPLGMAISILLCDIVFSINLHELLMSV